MEIHHDLTMDNNIGGTTFPPEIMLQIMSRIPAKPLTTFKKVNKSWEKIISSRQFVTKNFIPTGIEINRLGFFFQTGAGLYPIEYQRKYDAPNQYERVNHDCFPRITVLCSAHELITFCNKYDEFFLKKPRNGEILMLPILQVKYPENIASASALFGMGYISQSDEYIVVRVTIFEEAETNFPSFLSCVHIYSTKSRMWSYFGEFPYDRPVADPGVWAGGCINWLVKKKLYNDCIASYDCLLGTFKILDVPSSEIGDCGLSDLGSLNPQTLVIYSSIAHNFENWEFWILWEYHNHSSWTRMRFAPGFVIPNDEFILGIQPLCLRQVACNQIMFRLEPYGRFVVYNIKKGTYSYVRGPRYEEDCCDVFPFVQSLVRFRQLL